MQSLIDDPSLIYPMFALVLLTFSAVARLFVNRVQAVRERKVDPRYFLTYQDGSEPVALAQLSRNFSNLLEAPTLFYPACLAAMLTGQSTLLIVGLAWAYVILRIIHTLIHTGPNLLYPRIAAYFTSWAVLLALWISVVVGISGNIA